MRNTLLVLAFLIAGVAGAVTFAAVAFGGMFYGLRLVSWVAKSDDFTAGMWLVLIVVPLAALFGLVLCGGFAAVLLSWRLDPASAKEFEGALDDSPDSAELARRTLPASIDPQNRSQ